MIRNDFFQPGIFNWRARKTLFMTIGTKEIIQNSFIKEYLWTYKMPAYSS